MQIKPARSTWTLAILNTSGHPAVIQSTRVHYIITCRATIFAMLLPFAAVCGRLRQIARVERDRCRMTL